MKILADRDSAGAYKPESPSPPGTMYLQKPKPCGCPRPYCHVTILNQAHLPELVKIQRISWETFAGANAHDSLARRLAGLVILARVRIISPWERLEDDLGAVGQL